MMVLLTGAPGRTSVGGVASETEEVAYRFGCRFFRAVEGIKEYVLKEVLVGVAT
ncbi:MAG: hypothetical protein M1305_01900 [Candidatus Marsarchaeota archaeon]|nr:hypothetical protein [Candidatus Marsarchaeota archaeon]